MTDFKYEASDDPMSEDNQYVLIANPNITVQVCAYGGRTTYAVNEHGYDDPKDEDSFWMRDHGEFRTLKAAKAKAVSLATVAA